MKITDVTKAGAGAGVGVTPASAPSAEPVVGKPASDKAGMGEKVSVAHNAVVDEASRIARTNRTSRLKEIEAAVHQGSYRPDPAQIADRILEDAVIAAKLRASIMPQ